MSFFVINRQYGFNPAIVTVVLMKKLVSVSGLGTFRNDLALKLNANSVEQVKCLCHQLTQLKESIEHMEEKAFIVPGSIGGKKTASFRCVTSASAVLIKKINQMGGIIGELQHFEDVSPERGYLNVVDIQSSLCVGSTALIYAVESGNIQIVTLLVEANANLEPKTIFGYTPLLIAANRNYEFILRLLLDTGADPNVKCNKGYNILHYSSHNLNITSILTPLVKHK